MHVGTTHRPQRFDGGWIDVEYELPWWEPIDKFKPGSWRRILLLKKDQMISLQHTGPGNPYAMRKATMKHIDERKVTAMQKSDGILEILFEWWEAALSLASEDEEGRRRRRNSGEWAERDFQGWSGFTSSGLSRDGYSRLRDELIRVLLIGETANGAVKKESENLSRKQLAEALETDWQTDSAGRSYLDFSCFCRLVYEIPRNWCDTGKEEEYVHCLENMYRLVFGQTIFVGVSGEEGLPEGGLEEKGGEETTKSEAWAEAFMVGPTEDQILDETLDVAIDNIVAMHGQDVKLTASAYPNLPDDGYHKRHDISLGDVLSSRVATNEQELEYRHKLQRRTQIASFNTTRKTAFMEATKKRHTIGFRKFCQATSEAADQTLKRHENFKRQVITQRIREAREHRDNSTPSPSFAENLRSEVALRRGRGGEGQIPSQEKPSPTPPFNQHSPPPSPQVPSPTFPPRSKFAFEPAPIKPKYVGSTLDLANPDDLYVFMELAKTNCVARERMKKDWASAKVQQKTNQKGKQEEQKKKESSNSSKSSSSRHDNGAKSKASKAGKASRVRRQKERRSDKREKQMKQPDLMHDTAGSSMDYTGDVGELEGSIPTGSSGSFDGFGSKDMASTGTSDATVIKSTSNVLPLSNQEIDLQHQELEVLNLESTLHTNSPHSHKQLPQSPYSEYYRSIDSKAVSKKKERLRGLMRGLLEACSA